MSDDHPPGFFEGTEMPTAGWWEALWPDPAGVLAAVGLRPGMGVIDLCSGDGWFTLQIAKVARHVCAIDIDPNLLEVACHRLAENGLTNCDFVSGDAYDIAKLTAPADFVFLANAFHGVADRARLAEAVRTAHTETHYKCPLMTQSGHFGRKADIVRIGPKIRLQEHVHQSQRCGPYKLRSRSALKILLYRLAIHCRPGDVMLR